MKHSIEDTLAVVYRHYPRGIRRDDPRYMESEEHLRLVAARRKAGDDKRPWSAMLDRMQEGFPGTPLDSRSYHLPTGQHDACYSGFIVLPTVPGERSHLVEFMVSFLIPSYIVYSSRVIHDPEKAARHGKDTVLAHTKKGKARDVTAAYVDRMARRRVVSFIISPDEQPYADWLTREIEATFGAEPMPPEIGEVVVPDVATDDRRELGEATLYDCLFANEWRAAP